MSDACGLLVIDKPAGWTSHDVVARARRLCGTRRVGHAGTLDPMATGVLVLGVGRATKLLTFLVGLDKAYTATIRLGQATLTDDAEGEATSSVGVGDAALTTSAVTDASAATPGCARASSSTCRLGRSPSPGSRFSPAGRRPHRGRAAPPSTFSTSTSWSRSRPAPTFGPWPVTSASVLASVAT